MVFYLLSESGAVIYLLNNEYSIGRKDCNIVLQNDQSISRKHAVITIQDNKATVCDAGSKYNTYIDGAKIEAHTSIPLVSGNVVKFGMLNSIYTFQENKILTTLSNIKRNQKAQLKAQMKFLNGCIQDNWTPEVTHVTMEEILLTVKLLCAVIMGIPIVNLKFWEDYVAHVKQNLFPPNFKEYQPPCSEVILNQANVKLEYIPERKTLFGNKIFVFPNQQDKAKMVDLIICAGGEAISWDLEPFTKEVADRSSKEYLLVATDTKPDEMLLEMTKRFSESGKRTIPLQEIALAVIQSSCEKDCNPSFDRSAAVFEMHTQQRSTAKLLAQNTESQSQALFREIKTEHISTETSVIESTQNVTLSEPSTSVKREGDTVESSANKKIKLDGHSKSFPKSKTVDENVERVKAEPGPGKGLFAFKQAKAVEPKDLNVVVNPFAKKRKAEPIESPAKKTAAELVESPFARKSSVESVEPSLAKRAAPDAVSNTSASTLSENRFSNVLKAKNTPSIFKKRKKPQADVTTSSEISEAAGLHLYLSTVKPVEETLQGDFEWLSKFKPGKAVEKDREEVDSIILEYIESFKHTVIIEEEPSFVRKETSVVDNNNDSSVCNRNFKKFRKVKPVRLQTTIIPESSYTNITCDGKKSDPVAEENSIEED